MAILTHELGHHATRATKFALVTMWLALPWRFASRLVIGIGLATVGRRQPLRLLALVALAGVVVAVVQAVQQRQWAVAVVLSAVAVCAVVCPLADAAVSRRSEYAADRYAADVGVRPQLAGALQVLVGKQRRRAGLVARLLSRHPEMGRRIEALGGAPGRGLSYRPRPGSGGFGGAELTDPRPSIPCRQPGWHWRRTGRPNATRGIAEQIVVSDWMSRGVLLQVVPLAVMLNL